jgi:hypothetical protein
MTFLVTYELHAPGWNYTPFFAALKSSGLQWGQPMGSVWILKCAPHIDAKKLSDHLMHFLVQGDKLFVTSLGNYAGVLPGEFWHWLNQPA